MAGSGAVGLATSLTSMGTAQAMLSAQAGIQRGVLDLQQDVIQQLLAQMMMDLGHGVNLNLLA